MASDPNIHLLESRLRGATLVLSQLGLYNGAKWAAEALSGLKPVITDPAANSDSEDYEDEDVDESSSSETPDDPQLIALQFLSPKEKDRLTLAKTYYDCKEFDRAAHVLKRAQSGMGKFLRLYSLYLSGEKKKEEEMEGVLGQNDSGTTPNTNTPLILKELQAEFEHKKPKDVNPMLHYLHGLILLKQKCTDAGIVALTQSLKLYPYNWSCWIELLSALNKLDEAHSVLDDISEHLADFPAKTMVKIARVVVNQEFFQQFEELYRQLDELLTIFPSFAFLKTQKALISYHALEYQDAENLFDEILVQDPLRLDDLDTYSNILYVMEKKSKLSYLAQLACAIDKFRPETCCIIANYYSLKFEHEKAIMYYRRALTLNRNCLSAWTLMGHEFVELKNSHAAIESYRRAVDTNNKDFKAWYGLGQAYEVLDMHVYSLYYYQRACSLKPLDKRIWQALGDCYQKLEKLKDAVKCYKRALQLSDQGDVVIHYKLALLYEELNDIPKVYEHMKACYSEEIMAGVTCDETSRARLWLAKYEMEERNWSNAYTYAVDLNHGTSQELEEARSIAREARNRLNI